MRKQMVGATFIVAVALGAAACGGPSPTSTATGDTTGTTRAAGQSAMNTLVEKPGVSVTRPEVIREIPISDLPDEMRMEAGRLGLTDDESNCVDSTVYDYISGAGATADQTAQVTALGSAVTACVDQDRIAQLITRQVRVANVMITDAQAECIDAEVRNADPEALAVFLGAYTYDGAGVPEMQAPFIASFSSACNLVLG